MCHSDHKIPPNGISQKLSNQSKQDGWRREHMCFLEAPSDLLSFCKQDQEGFQGEVGVGWGRKLHLEDCVLRCIHSVNIHMQRAPGCLAADSCLLGPADAYQLLLLSRFLSAFSLPLQWSGLSRAVGSCERGRPETSGEMGWPGIWVDLDPQHLHLHLHLYRKQANCIPGALVIHFEGDNSIVI